MRRICGIRPTGSLHIGHWFSVIQPALNYGADVLIADYHAYDDDFAVIDTLRTLHRFGVGNILRQKEIFSADLYFKLLHLASIGDLERMTQYKSSAIRTAHLLTYPVLMAHDVYGYDEVLVGEDQKQHVEYSRRLLERFNNHYPSRVTPLPQANTIGGRIMSLRDPSSKMSKSDPSGCLFLNDEAEVIKAKIAQAVTTPTGMENLIGLYSRLNGRTLDFPADKNRARFKAALTETVIGAFAPS